jgi:hypothetical protein
VDPIGLHPTLIIPIKKKEIVMMNELDNKRDVFKGV